MIRQDQEPPGERAGLHPDRAPRRHHHPRHPRRDRRPVLPELPRQGPERGREGERPLGDPGRRELATTTTSGRRQRRLHRPRRLGPPRSRAPGVDPNVEGRRGRTRGAGLLHRGHQRHLDLRLRRRHPRRRSTAAMFRPRRSRSAPAWPQSGARPRRRTSLPTVDEEGRGKPRPSSLSAAIPPAGDLHPPRRGDPSIRGCERAAPARYQGTHEP